MDFFAAQDRARRQSRWLVVLFIAALVTLVVAFYAVATGGLIALEANTATTERSVALPLWDPIRLFWVVVVVVGIVGGASLVKMGEFRAGGTAVAEQLGGRRIDPTTRSLPERRLYNVVEEMSIAAGVPVPAVYVLDAEPGINAFAAGHNPENAAVAVSRGGLDALTRDELQGVIAHEFSHILNGDMRLNLRLAGIIFGLFVLSVVGLRILAAMRFAGRGNRKGGGGILIAILAAAVAFMVLGACGQFFGRLIQAAVSRQREFLADASAIQFTRNPGGIRDALRRIGGATAGSRIGNPNAQNVAHFFFASGLRSHFGGLFRTHPPLDQRVRAVDPRWDGTWLEGAARGTFATADGASSLAGAAAPAEAAAVAPADRAAPPPPPLPDGGLARSLRDRFETILPGALAEPGHAAALVLGLLLESDPAAAPWKRIEAALGGPVEATVTRWIDPLADLDRAHRLPLFELLMPPLQTLPGPDRNRLREAARILVEADRMVSRNEFIYSLLLKRRLDGRRVFDDAPNVPAAGRKQLPEAFGRVFSLLAQAAAESGGSEAGAAFSDALASDPEWRSLSYRPIAATDYPTLEADFEALREAPSRLKGSFLQACRRLILADRTVRVEERELYRLIGVMLGAPQPPLGD